MHTLILLWMEYPIILLTCSIVIDRGLFKNDLKVKDSYIVFNLLPEPIDNHKNLCTR